MILWGTLSFPVAHIKKLKKKGCSTIPNLVRDHDWSFLFHKIYHLFLCALCLSFPTLASVCPIMCSTIGPGDRNNTFLRRFRVVTDVWVEGGDGKERGMKGQKCYWNQPLIHKTCSICCECCHAGSPWSFHLKDLNQCPSITVPADPDSGMGFWIFKIVVLSYYLQNRCYNIVFLV